MGMGGHTYCGNLQGLWTDKSYHRQEKAILY
jgi:hypothetical protein